MSSLVDALQAGYGHGPLWRVSIVSIIASLISCRRGRYAAESRVCCGYPASPPRLKTRRGQRELCHQRPQAALSTPFSVAARPCAVDRTLSAVVAATLLLALL